MGAGGREHPQKVARGGARGEPPRTPDPAEFGRSRPKDGDSGYPAADARGNGTIQAQNGEEHLTASTPNARANTVGAVILLAGTALSLLAGGAARASRAAAARATFREGASDHIRHVVDALTRIDNDLVAMQSLFLASDRVEPEEFSVFAANLLTYSPSIAYEWAPRVVSAERSAFEAGPLGGTGHGIVEIVGGTSQRAADRDSWYPIAYAEPTAANAKALGIDLAGDPDRRTALETARDSGRVATTPGIAFVQGDRGFLSMAPVYEGTPRTTDERRAHFKGVVVAVTAVQTLLRAALADQPYEDVVVTFIDARAPAGAGELGRYPTRSLPGAAPASSLLVHEAIDLGAAKWRLEARPAGPVPGVDTLDPSVVLAFLTSLAVSALIAGYVRLLLIREADASAHAARLSEEKRDRERAEADVRVAEGQFRQLAEEAEVGVYVLQDGRFRYCNPVMARMFGRAVESVVHHARPADLYPADPAVFEALSTSGNGLRREIRPHDGDELVLELHAAPTVFDGRAAVLGTLVDLTAQRRAEADQNRIERLESLGLLAGGIAHDFNNLLTAILGNLSLAELDVPTGTAAARRIEAASQAVLRASALTLQLQTFSRGGAPILAHTDLAAVLRETTGFALRGSSVACELEIPEDLWPVEADENQISRVIHNLTLNASQAMPTGGKLTVRARNQTVRAGGKLPAGRYVEVAVEDTGTGMSKEVRGHLFDPYYTTKPNGRGLGLATAHSIVRRHGGSIEVRSTEGVGTVFEVLLPATNQPAPKAPAPLAPSTSGGRVLVMDDDDAVRAVAVGLLASLGFVTEEARDGAEAVERYRRNREAGNPFDVVLLDLTVPGGMGGHEAMEQLRAIDPTVRCVASSGYSNDPHLTGTGFVAVLPKPYRRADVLAMLARLPPRSPPERPPPSVEAAPGSPRDYRG